MRSGFYFLIAVIVAAVAMQVYKKQMIEAPAPVTPIPASPPVVALPSKDISGLIQRLGDRDSDVRTAAVHNLIQYGSAVREVVMIAAKDEHRDLRENALIVLRNVAPNDKTLIPFYLTAMHDHVGPRYQCIVALMRFGPDASAATADLISDINSTDSTIALASRKALIGIGDEARKQLIAAALKAPPDDFATTSALEVLEEMDANRADTWEALWNAPDSLVKSQARWHLKHISPLHPLIQKQEADTSSIAASDEMQALAPKIDHEKKQIARMQARLDEQSGLLPEAERKAAAWRKKDPQTRLENGSGYVGRWIDTMSTLDNQVRILKTTISELQSAIADSSQRLAEWQKRYDSQSDNLSSAKSTLEGLSNKP